MKIDTLNPWVIVHGSLPGASRLKRSIFKPSYPNSSVKIAAKQLNKTSVFERLDYHFKDFKTWFICSRDDFEYEVIDTNIGKIILDIDIRRSITSDNTNFPYLVIHRSKFNKSDGYIIGQSGSYCIGVWNLIKGQNLEQHLTDMCMSLLVDEVHDG